MAFAPDLFTSSSRGSIIIFASLTSQLCVMASTTTPSASLLNPSSRRAQKSVVEPFATLGKLAYAPATHTTVVTTTTTTTTSFPPILINPPLNLRERDPKEYPLARSPAPEAIRRFFFEIAGVKACFEEAENIQESVQEVCVIHTRAPCSRSHSTFQTPQSMFQSH